MAGLKPMFTMAGVNNFMQERIKTAERKIMDALIYEGEEFVTRARELGTYQNQTSNLRNSIGYVILKDGREVFSSFTGDTEEGRNAGTSASRTIIQEVNRHQYKGYVLIGIAGMSYAAAVEAKGYDVITGAAPIEDDLIELFRAIKF